MSARCLALIVGLALIGCSAPESVDPIAATETESPRRGGTLVVGTSKPVSGWNEYTTGDVATTRWLRRIYEPLAVEVAGEPRFEPRLAESWSFDDSRTRLTFTLREAQWSDGEPITTDDVLFTWQVQRAEAIAWANKDTKTTIVDVVAESPREVTFVFERPGPYQLESAIEGAILPEHLYGAIPLDRWHSHDWSSLAGVGSGPFLLARQGAGEFVLERNPTVADDRAPWLDAVIVRVIDEPSTLVTQLRTGEIDLVDQLAPRDALRVEGESAVELVEFYLNDVAFVGWNNRRAPFDDPRVRRAVALAIDRDKVVEELLFGFGEVTNGLVPPSSSAAASDPPLAHDPTQARALLAQAGYDASRPLEFELLLGTGNELRKEIATKLQAQLSEVGVEMELRVMETRAMMGDVMSGEFDAFMRGFAIFGEPPLAAVFGSGAPFNVGQYQSDGVDRALDEMAKASDWDSYKLAADEVQRIVRAEQPMTFLYVRNGVAAHSAEVAGVDFDAPGDPMARLERFWRR